MEVTVFSRNFAGWLLLPVCVIVTLGCQGSRIPTGTVSGTITLHGKRLDKGIVIFHNAEMGSGATGEISPGGQYEIKVPLRVGKYRVAIQPPLASGPMAPIPESPIPPQYQDPETSGLVAEIKQGHNVVDFNL